MTERRSDLSQRISARVRELRATRALSLEALAQKCGVSRSMISLIERGETSPTAVVLEKLAVALEVTLSSLFDPPAVEKPFPSPIARRRDQPQWRDPASGYLRRNVSPPDVPQPMRIVEVEFPPGGRIAFESDTSETRLNQQLWVLEGTIDVTLGEEQHRLRQGDCLAMHVRSPTMFYNPTQKTTRYAVVVACEPLPGRR